MSTNSALKSRTDIAIKKTWMILFRHLMHSLDLPCEQTGNADERWHVAPDSAARLTQESRGFAPPTREGFAFSSAQTSVPDTTILRCHSLHCLKERKH